MCLTVDGNTVFSSSLKVMCCDFMIHDIKQHLTDLMVSLFSCYAQSLSDTINTSVVEYLVFKLLFCCGRFWDLFQNPAWNSRAAVAVSFQLCRPRCQRDASDGVLLSPCSSKSALKR